MIKKLCSFALAFVLVLFTAVTPTLARETRDIKPFSVDMSVNTMTMYIGQVRTLWALVLPVDGIDRELNWQSSNPEVAEVDLDGVVIGISPGTTVITASTANGKSDSCTVTVKSTTIAGIQRDLPTSELPGAEMTSSEILTSAALSLEVENAVRASNGQPATVTLRDKARVSTAALRAAAAAAATGGSSVSLRFVTPTTTDDVAYFFTPEENRPAQGTLSFNPSVVDAQDRDIRLRVYTNEAHTGPLRTAVAGATSAPFALVQIDQSGSFGFTVEVSAPVDLSALNTSRLQFYTWSEGRLTALSDVTYRIDGSGNLVFTTSRGGTVVVSDRSLE